jgi:hypothetical protein
MRPKPSVADRDRGDWPMVFALSTAAVVALVQAGFDQCATFRSPFELS